MKMQKSIKTVFFATIILALAVAAAYRLRTRSIQARNRQLEAMNRELEAKNAELEAALDRLSTDETMMVVRAYSYFSHLANIAEVLDMPEAAAGLVEYYRCISGEHPDWDEFNRAMVADQRLVVRFMPAGATGIIGPR